SPCGGKSLYCGNGFPRHPYGSLTASIGLFYDMSRVTKAHFHLAQYHALCQFPFHCTMGGTKCD
ncbi:MAG: hypothetical protein RSD94_13365, partial [Acinetobacter sp.]